MKKQMKAAPKQALRKALGKTTFATPPAPLAAPTVTRKLDLACGQRPTEGFEGVDIWPQAQHVVDLFKTPWPFEDNSVAELYCSHFMEHVPMVNVDQAGNVTPFGGQDLFFRLMDECYRILVPGGWMTVIVPSGRSDRAFQDPTHRRFFVETTFAYLSVDWRKANLLDHYGVKCNFGANVQTTVDTVLNTKHPEVAQREMRNFWNSTVDFHARLQSLKPKAE